MILLPFTAPFATCDPSSLDATHAQGQLTDKVGSDVLLTTTSAGQLRHMAGAFILLFGWMGFNPGSTLGATDLWISVVAVNTNLAAVAGSAAALIVWYWMFGKPDITMACNGMLAGLVAITAPCAFVLPTSAVIIGVIAGILVCAGVPFNERVLKVDDPCGAVSVHGDCGWFGAVAVGIFADGLYGAGWNGVGASTYLGVAGRGVTGLLHGDLTQCFLQLAGATLCAVYAFGGTYVVFTVVNRLWPLRVSRESELEGLDIPEFGMEAYPTGTEQVSAA